MIVMIALDKDTSVMIRLGACIDSNRKYRSRRSIWISDISFRMPGEDSVYKVLIGTK